MSKIKILSTNLINKIAAGEVVERPASVVKELLENCIDAGANKVSVFIEKGGQPLIKICDNGHGIDKNDIEKAPMRYATSKIKNYDDLFNLNTMGFRGEALAAISSCSVFKIKSKTDDAEIGTELLIQGGDIIHKKSCALNRGTEIEIKNLFFNTPARKKFLKGEQTEFGHVLRVINNIALSSPGIGIELYKNGRKNISLGSSDRAKRIKDLLGGSVFEELNEINFQGANIKVSGYIGKPKIARSGNKHQYLFVNGRPVRVPLINKAIKDAFASLLESGKNPYFVLFININPEEIDVNIHPQKEEIKFVDTQMIYKIMFNATKACIEKNSLTYTYTAPRTNSEKNQNSRDVKDIEEENNTSSNNQENFLNFKNTPYLKGEGYKSGSRNEGYNRSKPKKLDINQALNFTKAFEAKSAEGKNKENDILFEKEFSEYNNLDFLNNSNTENTNRIMSGNNNEDRTEEVNENKKTDFAFLSNDLNRKGVSRINDKESSIIKPIAYIKASYIICETVDGLMIFDQHAAHERIKYNLLQDAKTNEVQRQKLLIAEIIEVGNEDLLLIKNNKEVLNSLGFEFKIEGQEIKLNAVPSFIINSDLKSLFLGTLSEFKDPSKNVRDTALAYLACRSAIKFGDIISYEEQIALVNELQLHREKETCPHGRPTMIAFSYKELEKLFHRPSGSTL